ncbi:MAG: nicotinamide-nucleotide adenylyltransferase, partial [Thermoplasmata archaeon]|nr:nicotinamide-nucleotide adenylyltransferase [Thermoplasmata archaeon]NIS14376.1 nicotinamide-nucleotide adenylyltransferase [Thermoplasmata archaeon]NIS22203.1 nicotinamide-nucleotide adenylyltransferase [Thermoplasmata archaeon]NIT80101.1 nicotinamide-nucleotide adenylyltransferase [Thermoplasmata archaeon]NIU51216.1 nicotinamide-nucleotide adenylyltransferase [Thermoplasmata archaeon]
MIGRFQPFHRGHLSVIEEIAAEADELLIGIAAAEASGTPRNPFTAAERGEMVRRALDGAGLRHYRIIDLPDIHNPPVWAKYVAGLVPEFDVVVAHSDETLDLFREAGYEVQKAAPHEMETYSGTRIRHLMIEFDQWETLVPPDVAEYLKGIDG